MKHSRDAPFSIVFRHRHVRGPILTLGGYRTIDEAAGTARRVVGTSDDPTLYDMTWAVIESLFDDSGNQTGYAVRKASHPFEFRSSELTASNALTWALGAAALFVLYAVLTSR